MVRTVQAGGMLDLRHLTVYTGAGRLDPETRCAMEWLSVLRMMHHEAHTCSGNAGHPGRSLNPASVISLYVYPTRTIIVVGGAIRVALGGTLTATGYVTLLVAYTVASGWPTPSMQEKLSTWLDAGISVIHHMLRINIPLLVYPSSLSASLRCLCL